MDKTKKICVICKKEFEPSSPNQKMCGSIECKRESRRQYMRKHADLYRELNKKYRQKEEIKHRRAEYDKEYQKKNKEQIRQYKKMYFQKKQFLKYLDKGELLKNIYWFSLSQEEKQQVLDKLKI